MSIVDGQTDIGLISRIDVTFSESMDASTINDTTITVSGRAPKGHVEYDDATHTASFIPSTLYAAEVRHNFTISGSVTDESGNPIDPDTTSFQTGTLDTDHLDDYFEPNGSSAEATPVELGRRYRTLSITDGDDHDFFEFSLAETAKVLIHAWMKEVQGLSWVRGFEGADGEEYWSEGSDVDAGDSLSWSFYTFHPGTYCFHTCAHSYQTGYLIYDFKLTAEEPCRDDAYEDNNFIEESAQAAEGAIDNLRGCYSDEHCYSDVEVD